MLVSDLLFYKKNGFRLEISPSGEDFILKKTTKKLFFLPVGLARMFSEVAIVFVSVNGLLGMFHVRKSVVDFFWNLGSLL